MAKEIPENLRFPMPGKPTRTEIPGPKLDRPSREQYKQGLNEIFSGSIGDGLELDMRAETALTNIGINTIGELVQNTKTYLREITAEPSINELAIVRDELLDDVRKNSILMVKDLFPEIQYGENIKIAKNQIYF